LHHARFRLDRGRVVSPRVGSCFVSPSRREHEYAALQQKFAEADAWPLQKRQPAKRKRRRPLPYGRRAS
jgi:hypothetical protein